MRPVKKVKIVYYSKEILNYLFLSGAIMVAVSSPYFSLHLMRKGFSQYRKSEKRKAESAFAYLKRKGLIELRRKGYDVEIMLTKEGRKRAGKYRIDDIFIPRPKKWDKKWRVVIFDIPTSSNFVRNVFRKKLKEFGFQQIQMSVWVYPFPCKEEIDLLREFLGADKKQICLMEVAKMDNDRIFRTKFGI